MLTAPVKPIPTSIPKLVFRSAETCRSCHEPVFQEWKQSWMAKAYINNVFQTDFQEWRNYATSIGQNPNSCLTCHAPAGLLMADEKIGMEGVTCEVCHRVAKAKKKDNRYHLVMDSRNIEYSQNKTADTPFHLVKPSKSFSNSALCGGCHLDIQTNGFALERTFQEWSESSYAQNNIQCADCHMPKVSGSASISANGTYKNNGSHTSHRFYGGHSDSPLLQGVATLILRSASDGQQIQALVTNTRAGHNFPTGGAHPSELVLELSIKHMNGESISSDRRVYKIWHLNSKGQEALAGEQTETLRDTTLKPEETRIEVFKLPKSYGSIRAKLTYYSVSVDVKKKYDEKILETYYKPVVIAECTLPQFELGSEITCTN